jgi:hypothetical protein
VVDLSPHHLKVQGSSPVAVAIEKENLIRS